ncbi:hypothetical protein FVE85_3206 [Porphyridium purpureum]|uniref:Uncharacterized protein n=1 Tax=Porphyridium purpureum TaxID=35688 RepID=A0A5J4YUN6_PORPP|nr:hypothetical protein FVE85_3206 [Porphyridium purpureum]|eukprot:POR5256..scf227_4
MAENFSAQHVAQYLSFLELSIGGRGAIRLESKWRRARLSMATALSSLCVRSIADPGSHVARAGDVDGGKPQRAFRCVALAADPSGMAVACVTRDAVLLVDPWEEHAPARGETMVAFHHFGSSSDRGQSSFDGGSISQSLMPALPKQASVYRMTTSPLGSPRLGHNSSSGYDFMDPDQVEEARKQSDPDFGYRTNEVADPFAASTYNSEYAWDSSGGGSTKDVPAQYMASIPLPQDFCAAPRAAAFTNADGGTEPCLLVGGQDGSVALVHSSSKQKRCETIMISSEQERGASVSVPGKWSYSPRIRALATGVLENCVAVVAENCNVHVFDMEHMKWEVHANLPMRLEANLVSGMVSKEPILALDWSLQTPAAFAVGDAGGDLQVLDKRIAFRPVDTKSSGPLVRECAHGMHVPIRAVKWLYSPSASAPLLASAADDGAICIWDCRRGLDQPLFTLQAHVGPVQCLASGAFKNVHNVEEGLPSQSIPGRAHEPWDSPACVLASGGSDGIVRVWNLSAAGISKTTLSVAAGSPLHRRGSDSENILAGVSDYIAPVSAPSEASPGPVVDTGSVLAAPVPPPPPPPTPGTSSRGLDKSRSSKMNVRSLPAAPATVRASVSAREADSVDSLQIHVNKIWNVETYMRVVEGVRASSHAARFEAQFGRGPRSANPFARKKIPPLPSPDAAVGVALFNGLIISVNAEGIFSRAMLM